MKNFDYVRSQLRKVNPHCAEGTYTIQINGPFGNTHTLDITLNQLLDIESTLLGVPDMVMIKKGNDFLWSVDRLGKAHVSSDSGVARIMTKRCAVDVMRDLTDSDDYKIVPVSP